MVLDSPVDLSADAGSTSCARTRSGFEQALDDFLADCAADRKSAHSAPSGDPPRALATLEQPVRERLDAADRDRATGTSKRKAGVATFYIALHLRALRQASTAGPTLAVALDDARTATAALLALADLYNGRRRRRQLRQHRRGRSASSSATTATEPVPTFDDYQRRVRPRRSRVPAPRRLVGEHARSAATPASRGRRVTELGDVRADGAAPILVVGTTHDPATPFAGAEDLVHPARRVRGCSPSTAPSTPRTRRTACIDRRRRRATCCAGTCRREGTVCKA